MPRGPSEATHRGRRGRRTALTVRSARERIADLFELAQSEGRTGQLALSDRYVALAQRIGTRYNLRIPLDYRELYCRKCAHYWVEGRTVRTRLRGGRRIRTCLVCGHLRRLPNSPRRLPVGRRPNDELGVVLEANEMLAEEPSEAEEGAERLGSDPAE